MGTEDASEPDEDSDDPWLEHPGADFLEEMEELWEMQHDDFSDSMPSDEWDEDLPVQPPAFSLHFHNAHAEPQR